MQIHDLKIDYASRFLANTLHEIRTPIQTIISTVELIQDTHLDREQAEYIRQIQFSAEVLLDLANNILDFTKIRSKEFKLESIPFDITTITEQVVDLISIEAFNKGIEIVTDVSPSVPQMVSGDPVRVQQVMLNLIKNAVKFTNHGYIHVELSYNKGNIFFQVTDSGIGISEENKKQLFTEYFQGDISTYRKFGGSGLGLSICKQLISIMNGKIGVKSNPFGGSIFWFSVPLASAIANTNEITIPEIPKNTRVLIVDDNDLASRTLMKKLQSLGFKDIEVTADGYAAMNQLVFAERIRSPFTHAFIDMQMPLIDGWHLASEIMNNPELKENIKLFLLIPEGQMRKDAKMKVLNWYNGYIYKPIKMCKLKELVRDSLESFDDIESLESVEPQRVSESVLATTKASNDKFATGIKILIAEDHPVNRKIIETFLKGFGADVFIAEDGEQAIEQIDSHKDIDIIFMDIFMPKKSGTEATEELRKKGYKGIIIACTANNDSKDFKEYIRIGINDILVKPFKRASVKSMIEKWHTVLSIPNTSVITTLEPVLEPVIKAMPVWDKQEFYEMISNNMNFGNKLISDFISQTESLAKSLENAIASKDFLNIRKTGHTIKGSAAAIFAESISDAGRCIEFAAQKSDLTTILKSKRDFEEQFKLFKKTIIDFQNGK